MESQKRSYERIDHWEEEIDATKAKISSTDYAYIEEEKNVVRIGYPKGKEVEALILSEKYRKDSHVELVLWDEDKIEVIV